MAVTHSTVVVVADDGTSPVGTNEWNADHATATVSLSGVSANKDQLLIPDTTFGAGLTIGGDTNFYRYAANVLKTDDDFVIKNVLLSAATVGSTDDTLRLNGYGVMFANHNGGNTYILLDSSGSGTGSMVIQAGGGSATWGGTINLREAVHALYPGWVTVGLGVANAKFTINDGGFGGGVEVFSVQRDGKLYFESDTNLYRSAADTLKTDDSLVVVGSIKQSTTKTVLDTDHTGAADPHPVYRLESEGESNVYIQDPGTFTIPTAGRLTQPVRLALSSTNRLTNAGTGRAQLSDAPNDPSSLKYRVPGSDSLMADEYVTEYARVEMRGNSRRSMFATARSIITGFAPGGRLVLSGAGGGT